MYMNELTISLYTILKRGYIGYSGYFVANSIAYEKLQQGFNKVAGSYTFSLFSASQTLRTAPSTRLIVRW